MKMLPLLIFAYGLLPLVIFAQQVTIIEDTLLLDQQMFISSNTHLMGKPGNLIKIEKDGSPNKIPKGALVLDSVENIVIESVNFDLNASSNFATLIFILNSRNITIRNCNFYNSNQANASFRWTLHGINARNVDSLEVTDNYSDGCQFKLDGASYSATNVEVLRNEIKNCTQMGVSVVATADARPVEIRNITIADNTFQNIDNIAIYIGVDNGKGEYTHPFHIENILIAHNTIHELGYLNNKSIARGIQIRGTKNTRGIKVLDNIITDSIKSKHSRGIDIKKAQDDGYMRDITVQDNQIYNMDNFNLIVRKSMQVDVSRNICNKGRGILVDGCEDGIIAYNKTENTSRQILNESENIKELNNEHH